LFLPEDGPVKVHPEQGDCSPSGMKALAFDVYGTLVDPARLAEPLTSLTSAPAEFAATWRTIRKPRRWGPRPSILHDPVALYPHEERRTGEHQNCSRKRLRSINRNCHLTPPEAYPRMGPRALRPTRSGSIPATRRLVQISRQRGTEECQSKDEPAFGPSVSDPAHLRSPRKFVPTCARRRVVRGRTQSPRQIG